MNMSFEYFQDMMHENLLKKAKKLHEEKQSSWSYTTSQLGVTKMGYTVHHKGDDPHIEFVPHNIRGPAIEKHVCEWYVHGIRTRTIKEYSYVLGLNDEEVMLLKLKFGHLDSGSFWKC